MSETRFANGRPCVHSTVKGTCDRCRTKVERLHMLMVRFGWFCETCCPLCAEPPARLPPMAIEVAV